MTYLHPRKKIPFLSARKRSQFLLSFRLNACFAPLTRTYRNEYDVCTWYIVVNWISHSSQFNNITVTQIHMSKWQNFVHRWDFKRKCWSFSVCVCVWLYVQFLFQHCHRRPSSLSSLFSLVSNNFRTFLMIILSESQTINIISIDLRLDYIHAAAAAERLHIAMANDMNVGNELVLIICRLANLKWLIIWFCTCSCWTCSTFLKISFIYCNCRNKQTDRQFFCRYIQISKWQYVFLSRHWEYIYGQLIEFKPVLLTAAFEFLSSGFPHHIILSVLYLSIGNV